MAVSFKKDLNKYKDIDEDEILSKLSEEELKQLETVLEEVDPEVRAPWGQGGLFSGKGVSVGQELIKMTDLFIFQSRESFFKLLSFLVDSP